jgi:hypothetical protein
MMRGKIMPLIVVLINSIVEKHPDNQPTIMKSMTISPGVRET